MSETPDCGTLAGYRRHLRLGEDTCQACRDCRAAYVRQRTGAERHQVPDCGTRGGYRRHLRLGQTPCHACRAANTARYHQRREQSRDVEQHRLYVAARGRALSRLAERYPDEMAVLLQEELGPDDVVERKPWKWRTAS